MIKAAAKIKTEEDLAQQKIKAIKYLATIGCGCYPGVKDALLAALEDCTEEVRYEGALAFCEAAGNPCKQCNQSGCCAADVMTKLREMAYGQDDKCCFTEPSARVRAMAASALKRCQQIHPPGPQPAAPEGGGELPIEAPLPEPQPGEVPVNPVTATEAGNACSLVVNPVSLTRLPETDPQEATANSTLAGKLALASVQHCGVRGPCGICGGTACGPDGCRYGRTGAGRHARRNRRAVGDGRTGNRRVGRVGPRRVNHRARRRTVWPVPSARRRDPSRSRRT